MTWELVSLILGIILILTAAAIKIFKKNGESKLPQEFYDVKTQVGEQQIRFEEFQKSMDGKITGLLENIRDTNDRIKETNNKIDKLTELLIKFISEN